MVTKTCIQCGRKYNVKPYRAKQSKYCDMDCYLAANQKKVIKRCENCNKVFFAHKCIEDKRKHCSYRCKIQAQTKREFYKPCIWCKAPVFQRIPRRTKFCNRKCKLEYNQEERGKRVKIYCKFCLKAYYPKNPKAKYCSNSCYLGERYGHDPEFYRE